MRKAVAAASTASGCQLRLFGRVGGMGTMPPQLLKGQRAPGVAPRQRLRTTRPRSKPNAQGIGQGAHASGRPDHVQIQTRKASAEATTPSNDPTTFKSKRARHRPKRPRLGTTRPRSKPNAQGVGRGDHALGRPEDDLRRPEEDVPRPSHAVLRAVHGLSRPATSPSSLP